jgi:hypothetical protein
MHLAAPNDNARCKEIPLSLSGSESEIIISVGVRQEAHFGAVSKNEYPPPTFPTSDKCSLTAKIPKLMNAILIDLDYMFHNLHFN